MRTFALLSLGLLILSGCSSGPGGPAVHPVSGEVFYRGEPAVGAVVVLHPVSDPKGRKVSATVDDRGTFRVTTNTAFDGAPEGKYALTLSWTKTINVNDVEKETPDVFGRLYDDPRRPHSTVEVKPGDNRIPRIDLK